MPASPTSTIARALSAPVQRAGEQAAHGQPSQKPAVAADPTDWE